jgi:hypothetical protein
MKLRKFAAAVIVTTMVLGSTLTAFAENGPTDATGTISQEGVGESEGYVDKESVASVILPVVSAETFAFQMDPQRLIQQTDKARYSDFEFPDADDDTGVYFITGENKYENSSNPLYFVNKSSYPVTLTVAAKATDATSGDPIGLATTSDVSVDTGVKAPKLYLGLRVGAGETPQTITLGATASQLAVSIADVAENFEIAWDGEAETPGYVYQEKDDATTWKAIKVQLEGAVTELDPDKEYAAPTVDITWSWAKTAEGDADGANYVEDYEVTPAVTSYVSASTISASSRAITVTLPEGVTVTGLDLTKADGTEFENFTAGYTVSGNVYTFESTALTNWSGGTITFNFSDEHEDTVSIE